MVDFNAEATIGTPAANVVKILLLQARANTIESLEYYNKKITQGVEVDQAQIKSRIGTWFLEHQAYLKRTLKKSEFERLEKSFKMVFFNQEDLKTDELMQIITDLNQIMDNLRITRVDLKRQYDKSDVEADNKYNDLG